LHNRRISVDVPLRVENWARYMKLFKYSFCQFNYRKYGKLTATPSSDFAKNSIIILESFGGGVMFRKNNQLDIFSCMMYDAMIQKDHKLRRLNAACDLGFIDGLVEGTYAPSRRGAPGYDPSVLFKILLLRRLYKLSLDKVLERCQCDVSFRWFAGLNVQDELPCKATLSTFSRFRLDNARLRKVFNETVRQAKALGLIRNTKLLVDGTVVKGNFASRSQGKLIMILAIRLLKTTDLWGEVPMPKAESLEDRIGFGKATLALLNTIELTQRQQRKKSLLERFIQQQGCEDKIVHFKDEDARRTVRKDQNKVGYTTLIGMDSDSSIATVIKTVPANREEGQYLLPMVEEHVSLMGCKPDQVLADTAFGHGANLKSLFEQDILPLIPPRSSYTPGVFHRDQFAYDEESKTLRCPAGHTSTNQRPFRGGLQFRYSKKVCQHCPLREQCTTSNHRRVEVSQYNTEITRVNVLLDSKHDGYVKVRMKVEYKFAEAKRFYGLDTADGYDLESAERQSLFTFAVTNMVKISTLLFGKGRVKSPLPHTL